MNVIAYTYDADVHCIDCARRAFSSNMPNGIEPDQALDSEGNPVHPLFSTDEWFNVGEGNQTLSCGDCGNEIDTYTESD